MVIQSNELKLQGKVVFAKIIMQSNFRRIPKYFTENEACFLFLTKGALQFRTPENLLPLEKGDAILAKCGQYFLEQKAQHQNSKDGSFSVVVAYFYPELVKGFFQTDFSIQQFQKDYDVTKVNIEPLMKLFIEGLNFIFENPSVADDNLITNKLKELLLLLSKSESAPSVNALIQSLFVPHQYQFQDIIQKNIYADVSIEDLAHLCNLSLSSFKRVFKETFNDSPAHYIKAKRLQKAAELLVISPPLRITDICFDCGFNDAGHFAKSFTSFFGCSPSAYRDKYVS